MRRGALEIGGSVEPRKLKTAEVVARRIATDIVNTHLSPGDYLPPEGVMLEHYGVSRESLREALRLLEVQGLITLRRGPGGGPIVGYVDPASLGRTTTLFFQMAGATYRDFFEAWALSETLLAGRAARNPDSARRARLMAPFMHAPTDVDAEVDAEVSAHTEEFHSAIAQLASNPVLELVHGQLNHIARHHVLDVDEFRVRRRAVVGEHAQLAKSIVAGHATRAERLMLEHVQETIEFVESEMRHVGESFIDWR